MAYLLWSWWWAATLSAAAMTFWLLQTIRKPNLPPGPRGLPILGYFPFLGTHLHKTFTELAQVHGPIHKLWLGQKIYVVISSPLLAKQVRDNDVAFANCNPVIATTVLTYGANDIAFSPYGLEWKKLRKVFMRELLSNSRLDASYMLRKQEVGKALADVYWKKRGEALDFGQLVFMTISNTILSMLWGSTIHGKEGEKFFSRVRELSSEFVALQGAANVSDYIPGLARFDLQGIGRKSRRVLEVLDEIFCSTAIDQRRKKLVEKAEKETTKDFLQRA
ncbi:unnamed protein product [Linum tenue]|uniref:Cytochrome P450 n=1 Tax=Linum tenue TaxID=586396 RepID=A0AAV0JXS5_9ROSI|nr:unnamed protein product [Linum tenue]